MNSSARRPRPWPARLVPGVVAMALAMPGAALPYSLHELLQMPLERLLELEVVPRRTSQGGQPGTLTVQDSRPRGGPRHAV